MEHASGGRRKTRVACEQCKRLKRKCNGRLPCQACVRYDYKCEYADRSISGHLRNPEDTLKQAPAKRIKPTPREDATIEPSTAPFTADLLKNLSNDTNTVAKVRGDSWNLGIRQLPSAPQSFLNLVSLVEAEKYAGIYFSKINSIYGLINQTDFTSYLTRAMQKEDPLSAPYAAVVCYVIALGSLFSATSNHSSESEIAGFGRIQLERCIISIESESVIMTAIGWLLRALYNRMAADRHSAWFASISALTLLERVYVDSESGEQDIHCCHFEHKDHAKLHKLARLLNLWIANELDNALRRAVTQSLPCTLPDNIPSTTLQLLSLYDISVRLCSLPKPPSLSPLLEILVDLEQNSYSVHDLLQLHISNHALCTYRIMRQTKSIIPTTTIADIIRIGLPGIAASVRLAKDQQPWWHVVHVPFQYLCVLLSMDTRESLSQISSTLGALREILTSFPTRNMNDVVAMAESLVHMCRKNKLEEANVLEGGVSSRLQGPVYENMNEPVIRNNTLAGLETSDFDWDVFMQSCMPLFEDNFPTLS